MDAARCETCRFYTATDFESGLCGIAFRAAAKDSAGRVSGYDRERCIRYRECLACDEYTAREVSE